MGLYAPDAGALELGLPEAAAEAQQQVVAQVGAPREAVLEHMQGDAREDLLVVGGLVVARAATVAYLERLQGYHALGEHAGVGYLAQLEVAAVAQYLAAGAPVAARLEVPERGDRRLAVGAPGVGPGLVEALRPGARAEDEAGQRGGGERAVGQIAPDAGARLGDGGDEGDAQGLLEGDALVVLDEGRAAEADGRRDAAEEEHGRAGASAFARASAGGRAPGP